MYGVRACVRVRVPRKEMVAPIHDICFSHQGQHLLGHALGELRVLQRVSSDFEEAALCAVGHSLDVGAGGAVVVCRRGAVTAEAAGVRRAVRVVRALRPTPTDHGRRLTIDPRTALSRPRKPLTHLPPGHLHHADQELP